MRCEAQNAGVRIALDIQLHDVEAPLSFRGRHVRIEPVTHRVEGPRGVWVDHGGIHITARAMTNWLRTERACDLARLVASAAIDLRTRVPTVAHYEVTVGRLKCDPPGIEEPAAYELIAWRTTGDLKPYVVTLTEDGVWQVGEFIEGALSMSTAELWGLGESLASIEQAAESVDAFQRLRELWTGLEAITPQTPRVTGAYRHVEAWIDYTEASSPGFVVALTRASSGDIAALVAERHRFAGLPTSGPDLRSVLATAPSGQRDELVSATAALYALRNAIIHGALSRHTAGWIDVARAAEVLAWNLIDAAIWRRVCRALAPLTPARQRVAVRA